MSVDGTPYVLGWDNLCLCMGQLMFVAGTTYVSG